MSAERQREVIRVLIAEDEEPLRSAIADLVDSESQLEVAGAAGSADEAIAVAAESRPHVALVDVRMPGGGAQAARGIREQSPETRIVALSAYEDHATVVEMLRAGAVGYLVKGVAPVEVVEAIRRAARGQASISVDVLVRAIEDLSGAADAIARQNAQAEREREHAERRALLAHLVAAAEEERSRIAGDIHDDSIQAITAAGMRLQILRKSLDDPEQLRLLGDLEQTIQLAIARLRHLLFELRPPVLDNEGLSAALEMYLHEAEGQAEVRYRLEDRLETQPPLETRTIMYRIVQEALTNVRKHARASNATVSLHQADAGYTAVVTDDGVGFAPEVAEAPGHLGLASMRERAQVAGGWLRIDTAPGRGTTVEVWLPDVPDSDFGDFPLARSDDSAQDEEAA